MSRPRSNRALRDRREVRLDEPGSLRVLAHPARLTIVDELYQGHELTASELAELAGLSPSAMSYHLRALERWGVVERGAARGDGRERPWRARGRSLQVTGDSGSAALADVVAGGVLAQLRDALRRWSLVEAQETPPWREAAGMNRSFLWLTEEEVDGLSAELKALLTKYTADRDAVHHPDGTRRVLCVVMVVPDVPGTPAEKQGQT